MSAKVSSTLVLTARLSSIITSVVSVTYLVLTVFGLIFYFNCDTVDLQSVDHSEYFWTTLYRVYLQDAECEQSLSIPDLTQSFTMFILMIITMSFAVINLVTSIILTSLVNNENIQYLNVYVYTYIASWVATLVVDLTLASHLGMDITYLTKELDSSPVHNPLLDTLRQGAFYLMTISLKGYVIYVVQLALICLIIFYLYEQQEMSTKDEHSIHKVGAINAFDQPRRPDEAWRGPDMYAIDSFPRGQLNNGYADDFSRSQHTDSHSNSRNAGSFRRSDSWNQGNPSLPPASSSSARPFSYLEEMRRPAPLKSTPPKPTPAPWPAARPQLASSNPPVRVPAPDYSPPTSRQLKSALKTNYM